MPTKYFYRLPKEKRETIIYGCLEEIAEHGFENASTNRIVKKVGISKGSLFKYFDTKEDILIFLIMSLFDQMIFEIQNNLEFSPDMDLLDRFKQLLYLDIELFLEHPILLKFIIKMLKGPYLTFNKHFSKKYDEVKGEIKKRISNGIELKNLRLDIDTTIEILYYYYYGLLQDFLIEITQNEPNQEMIDSMKKRVDFMINQLRNGIIQHPQST